MRRNILDFVLFYYYFSIRMHSKFWIIQIYFTNRSKCRILSNDLMTICVIIANYSVARADVWVCYSRRFQVDSKVAPSRFFTENQKSSFHYEEGLIIIIKWRNVWGMYRKIFIVPSREYCRLLISEWRGQNEWANKTMTTFISACYQNKIWKVKVHFFHTEIYFFARFWLFNLTNNEKISRHVLFLTFIFFCRT